MTTFMVTLKASLKLHAQCLNYIDALPGSSFQRIFWMQHMGTAKKRNVVCGGTHALLLPQSFSSDEWYTCQEYHCDASILTTGTDLACAHVILSSSI